MSITEFEEEIELRRNAFIDALNEMIQVEHASLDDWQKLQTAINDVHRKATSYFSKFEESISLYEHPDYKAGKNIQTAKVNSTKIVLDTILNFWKLFNTTYLPIEELSIPSPNADAYKTMQQYLASFDKTSALELKQKFEENKLPVSGFDFKKKINPLNIIQMTRKQQTTFGIIAGVILLIALIVLTLVFGCQTQQADKIFTIVLALAAAAFAMAITGRLEMENSIVNAGGPMAIFALIFFFNPAQVEDFKSCQSDVSGTVFYGDNIIDNVNIGLIKSDQSTSTNSNGNFTINNVDFSSLTDTVSVKVFNQEIQLDTIIEVKKESLKNSIDIKLAKHCVTCRRTDSIGNDAGRVEKCAASKKYIENYIEEYTKNSIKLGLTVNCVED